MSDKKETILSQELHSESKLVFAFLGSRNLGDFAEQVVIAAAVKENLEGYRLAVFYNKDRPYKQQIVSLCPAIDIVLPGRKSLQFPINIFDVYADRRGFDDPALEAHGMNKSSVILAGNSLPTCCLPSFDYVPRLSLPVDDGKRHEMLLKELGVDPDRWFACIYWREPGFNDRTAHPQRDILDTGPYFAVIDHIVDDLGGQVVRLGHPTDTTLRKHPDIIDIAKVKDSLMTQITAISRARYFISSPSGPLTFGSAFGTPTVVTDNIDISGVWNEDDLLMTQTIVAPNGERFWGRAAFDAGFLATGPDNFVKRPGSGYRYIKNTAVELLRVTRVIHERTIGNSNWRENRLPQNTLKSDWLPLPLRASIRVKTFLD